MKKKKRERPAKKSEEKQLFWVCARASVRV